MQKTIVRAATAAVLLATWLPVVSPIPLRALIQMPVSSVIAGSESASSQDDDATLANACAWPALFFIIGAATLLPVFLVLLHSFPRDQEHMRAWDTVALVVGTVTLIRGGWSVALFVLGSRPSQDSLPVFFALPIFVTGVISTCVSYRMFKREEKGSGTFVLPKNSGSS